MREIREKVAAIQDNPFVYSVKYNEIRTAQVKDFPHLVHFKVEESLGVILMIAVIHTSRNPEIWDR